MFSDYFKPLCLLFLVLFVFPAVTSSFYFSRRHADQVYCLSSEDYCTPAEKSRLRSEIIDTLTRKYQDRVLSIRQYLSGQIQIFEEFFSKTLRTIHMDLDIMFSDAYGSFYQENIQTLNDFFLKIRSFSVSFAQPNMRTIVKYFFDELFRVMFTITNPFYAITEEQKSCMDAFYEEIQVFDNIPQKIINQLSLPLLNWKHFIGSLESLHGILEGYLNITLKEECVRGLIRMETCAQCQRISEKPCNSFCVNILSGCTHQMLDSEGAWKSTTESLIKLANQLNSRQNLVSAFKPIPVLISEAVMIFQEKRDFITNKMIGKCLLDKKEFGLEIRKKRHSKEHKMSYATSRKSHDHLILNQIFETFIAKIGGLQTLFGNVPEQLCIEEKWGSQENEKCWNGTGVGSYPFSKVNYSNPFNNPEYQGTDFLTFRGNYIEERLRLRWLQSRITHILSKKGYHEMENQSVHRAEAMTDDEDYNDDEYEGSASSSSSSNNPSSKFEYSPYFKNDNDKLELIIEPYPVKSASILNYPFLIPVFCTFLVFSLIC